jgi:4-amino-4-deoxy-L-arabinose transferase-like glycosyltransferase
MIQTQVNQQAGVIRQSLAVTAVAVIIFLAVYNLTNYPVTWFDEGSHLHVPKTFVRFGVYADYSSEGFRYYGPTIGVGPTVMLPIAVVFRFFGIGLLQARLVMALYLLATIYIFYNLALHMGGRGFAWVALVLLISSRGVALLEYGRQVLGEVPGLFFLVAGLWLWFAWWERAGWWRLSLVGLLLGLAMVTKYQYLLVLAPALSLAWLANLTYYRSAPQRLFIIPGFVAAFCFGLWQVYLILYLGPATASENLAMLRDAAGGAALSLSPHLMAQSIELLQSRVIYLGSLLPVLVYGIFFIIPRQREGQQWAIIFLLVVVNLVWFVIASIGWLRYAFLGLAFSSLFVGRFFYDLTGGFRSQEIAFWKTSEYNGSLVQKYALRWAMLIWLAAIVALPLGKTLWQIATSSPNASMSMAAYLDENVPLEALIETWEPEMGFLTNHNYHFPPASLLSKAVSYVFLEGPPPTQYYKFVQTEFPEYVLVGNFAKSVELYPTELLAERYKLVTIFGGYELYALKQ